MHTTVIVCNLIGLANISYRNRFIRFNDAEDKSGCADTKTMSYLKYPIKSHLKILCQRILPIS